MMKTNVDFDRIDDDVERVFKREINNLVKLGTVFMKDMIPVKSGHLKNSIKHDDATIWTTANYYKFVNAGTKPHTITGHPLVFEIGGITIFTTKVHHPGTKPLDITEKTVDHMIKKIKGLEIELVKVL